MAYRFKQCVKTILFKYFNEQCPSYLKDVFDVAVESSFQLRGSFQKLKCQFRKTDTDPLALSNIVKPFGIKLWNTQTY